MLGKRTALSAGLVLLGLLASALPGGASAAEPYPTKPIEVIVPTPPGGGVDISTRLLAEVTEPFLGQKLVVINKSGGSGTVGMATLTQAKPDGYALASVWNAPLTIMPHTLQVPYTLEDLVPIFPTGGAPLVFCVRPEFPAGNAKEFIDVLRKNPRKFTFGTEGVGGLVQLTAERVFQTQATQQRPVPFGGAGETMKAFLGAHVDFFLGPISVIQPHVKAGKARCVLVTARERTEAMPEAASLADIGAAQVAGGVWRGIIGPKGLPADRLTILEKAFRQGVQSAKYRDFMKRQGEYATGNSAADLAELIHTEHLAFGQIVKELGLGKK